MDGGWWLRGKREFWRGRGGGGGEEMMWGREC